MDGETIDEDPLDSTLDPPGEARDPDEREPDEPEPDEWAQRIDSDQEASYCCWACGEEIVIPIDMTMGARQHYVEDCPVCCRPNGIHVEIEPESGQVRCWNDPEG